MSVLEVAFPNLADDGYRITSPVDPAYNCVAWATEESDRWWGPDVTGEHYWPPSVTREETLDAFVAAFATLGYLSSDSARLEPDFVKVAVFAKSGLPTHVARQLPSGRWTSKLGHSEDIEHVLHGLTGLVFGQVAVVLKRPIVNESDSPAGRG